MIKLILKRMPIFKAKRVIKIDLVVEAKFMPWMAIFPMMKMRQQLNLGSLFQLKKLLEVKRMTTLGYLFPQRGSKVTLFQLSLISMDRKMHS